LSGLEQCFKTVTHVLEFKVSTCLRACVPWLSTLLLILVDIALEIEHLLYGHLFTGVLLAVSGSTSSVLLVCQVISQCVINHFICLNIISLA